jgi:hypothetical protein
VVTTAWQDPQVPSHLAAQHEEESAHRIPLVEQDVVPVQGGDVGARADDVELLRGEAGEQRQVRQEVGQRSVGCSHRPRLPRTPDAGRWCRRADPGGNQVSID